VQHIETANGKYELMLFPEFGVKEFQGSIKGDGLLNDLFVAQHFRLLY
jgi:hypothetical protein